MTLVSDIKKELSKRGRADLKLHISTAFVELEDLSVENIVDFLISKFPEKKIYVRNIIKSAEDARLYNIRS